jgi:fluoride exporter
MTGYLLVALGAAVGAPLRYLVDRFVQARHRTPAPLGTLTVNIAGSLLLGGLTGAAVPHDVLLVAGVGLCGALTTWSTLAFETVRLGQDRRFLLAAGNLLVSVVFGVAAAWAGSALLR